MGTVSEAHHLTFDDFDVLNRWTPGAVDGEAGPRLFAAARRILHAHGTAADMAGTGVLLLVSTLWLARSPFWSAASALVQCGLVLPLVWRRQRPTAVFVVLSLVAALQWWLGYRLVGDGALLVALYSLAVYESRRRALLATGVLELGAIMAATRWAPAGSVPRSFLFLTATVVAALCAGLTVRSGSQYMAWLAERAERLELERDQQKAIGAALERTRIAREIHDIVAHSLSVVITLADAAATVNPSDPERAGEAIRHVSEVGRRALNDVRSVVNVLRTDERGVRLGPQPDMNQLDDLFNLVRTTGLAVDVAVEGDRFVLGAATELTIYRILQEALTNTIKHARATRAHVSLLYRYPLVELRVTDDGTGSADGLGCGHGIEGMAERANLHGGVLEAGPERRGGWVVSAVLRPETVSART